MEIQLPKIIDNNTIITSDGFTVSLDKNEQLARFQKIGGTHFSDVFEKCFRIFESCTGEKFLILVRSNVDVDYNEHPQVFDMTNWYIFKHNSNMFKFGAMQGVLQWKEDLNKDWITNDTITK